MTGNIIINFKNNKIILPKNKKYMKISPFIFFDVYNMKDKVIIIGKKSIFNIGDTQFNKIENINLDIYKDKVNKVTDKEQIIKLVAENGINIKDIETIRTYAEDFDLILDETNNSIEFRINNNNISFFQRK